MTSRVSPLHDHEHLANLPLMEGEGDWIRTFLDRQGRHIKLCVGVALTILGVLGVADGATFDAQTGREVFELFPSLASAFLLVSGLIVVAKRDQLHGAAFRLPGASRFGGETAKSK